MFKRELENTRGVHWAQESIQDDSWQFPILVISSLEVFTMRRALSWFGLVQENWGKKKKKGKGQCCARTRHHVLILGRSCKEL